MKQLPKIIAVDFDGTIVEHMYPDMGQPVPGAIRTLRKFKQCGVLLILWTMRSGETLEEAVQYCKDNGIEFWSVNDNPEQLESRWSTSPEAYAQLYIDDAAYGCPLVTPSNGRRPYVDWIHINNHFFGAVMV